MDEDQALDPVRVGRREQRADIGARRDPDERRPLRSNLVEHRGDIAHACLESHVPRSIRKTRPAWVDDHEPCLLRKPLEEHPHSATEPDREQIRDLR